MIIRRAGPADLPAVAELLRLVGGVEYDLDLVGSLLGDLDPESYHAWLALDVDRPAGITMLETRTVRCGERSYRAGYWTNLYIRPEYRATKLYPRLPLAMFAGAREVGLDFIYGAIRRQEVARAHLAIGMKQVGVMPVLAQPLRPFSLIAKHMRWGAAAALLGRGPDAVYRAVLGLRRPAAGRDLAIEETPLDSPTLTALTHLARASSGDRIHQAWTEATLRKRLELNWDREPYRLITARRKGRLVAGVVLRLARRDTIRAAVVIEIFGNPSDPAVRSCLEEVRSRAMRMGAEVVLCLPGWDVQGRRVLRSLGYRESPENYVLMWYNSDGVQPDVPMEDPARWMFAFIDHDAF